jgi:hypothetical protein
VAHTWGRRGHTPVVRVTGRRSGRVSVAEGAWSVMKNGLGNLAPGTTTQLAAIMRYQLDRIQRRAALIAGFLGQTGLILEPEPP